MTFHDASGRELRYGPAEQPPSEPVPEPPSEVLSAEQVRATTEWTESGRLRLRRRVVSETRTIEVVVHREELVVETVDVDTSDTGTYVGTALDGPPAAGPGPTQPFVTVLHEEVPVVTMRRRAYERVTAHVDTVDDTTVVHHTLRREQAEQR